MAEPHEGLKWVSTSVKYVADLDRSTRFYEGLGFKEGPSRNKMGGPGSADARLVGLPGPCKFTLRLLIRPEMVLGITRVDEPSTINDWLRNPFNKVARGTVALFQCPDAKAMAKHLVGLGGSSDWEINEGEREGGRVYTLFVTDPDGYRIELMTAPEAMIRAHSTPVSR